MSIAWRYLWQLISEIFWLGLTVLEYGWLINNQILPLFCVFYKSWHFINICWQVWDWSEMKDNLEQAFWNWFNTFKHFIQNIRDFGVSLRMEILQMQSNIFNCCCNIFNFFLFLRNWEHTLILKTTWRTVCFLAWSNYHDAQFVMSASVSICHCTTALFSNYVTIIKLLSQFFKGFEHIYLAWKAIKVKQWLMFSTYKLFIWSSWCY